VINTHVHFDHVGGNHSFCGVNSNGCTGVCMGCRDRTFTENYEINSLAMAHSGAKVKTFSVSRWLSEGDLIYLDDKNPTKEDSLEVLFTPGHTPDSISLYAHWEKRLFVGDHMYPFTVVHLDCIGSNINDYLSSTKKLIQFIANNATTTTEHKQATLSTKEESPLSATPDLDTNKKETIQEFRTMLGLDDTADRQFSIETLMDLCEWNLSGAVELYLSCASEIGSMCPPKPATASLPIQSNAASDIVISCGHVESNLSAAALGEVEGLLEAVRAGALPPQHIDGDYGEYSNGSFVLMLPTKQKWNN